MNGLRTVLLMALLGGLMVVVGGALGGKSGLLLGLGFAAVTNLGAYWFSDKVAIMSSGARPVSREEAPELYDIVEGLCKKADLPVPTIHIVPTESPNAFATGRDPQHAAVAVTVGIMRILNKEELEAVLAHELGHVRNRDILITSMACMLGATITFLSRIGMYGGGRYDDRDSRSNPIMAIFAIFLAPIAAWLIRMAISRAREYQADASGAELCHNPIALANALAKLQQGVAMQPMSGNPAFSSLYIVKPDQRSWLIDLMSDHPPIPERIERLQAMAREMHQHDYV